MPGFYITPAGSRTEERRGPLREDPEPGPCADDQCGPMGCNLEVIEVPPGTEEVMWSSE